MASISRGSRFVAALLFAGCLCPIHGRAQTNWTPVSESSENSQGEQRSGSTQRWDAVPQSQNTTSDLVWEPLSPEQADTAPEDLIWKEASSPADTAMNEQQAPIAAEQSESADGLRWPNGQLMSAEDQIYFRTAYSRGSMIQIGETVYPNLGYNALQRKPGSWINLQLSAIDDSLMVSPSPCEDNDFFDQCADGISTNWVQLWADQNFSLDLQWTIHSLSGEGAPFELTVNETTFGNDDIGTKFGEGQSLGLKLSKNFSPTFGISFGADRLYHLDKTTDLPKNIYLMGTKVVRLTDALEPPILSFSAGLMTDVYNPMTQIGSVKYPKSIRGGQYPSIFSAGFDSFDGYTENTAGASSAFVCAERSIFRSKPSSSVDKSCLEEVFVGPVGSIGFAPWPWIGLYAIYTSWDLNLGVSVKPFKEINWTVSVELVGPFAGINPGTDRHMNFATCPGENYSFSSCRTRLGLFTDLSF